MPSCGGNEMTSPGRGARHLLSANARTTRLVQCYRDRDRCGGRRNHRADRLVARSTARLVLCIIQKKKPHRRQRGSLRLTGSAAVRRMLTEFSSSSLEVADG